MDEILYPWGYTRTMVNKDRLFELARFDLLDAETRERFEAWIISRGGQIGIGGAVRFVQPDKYGFAPPGKSFHELQTWSDGVKNFAALDLVVQNGSNVHRAPTWAEVPKQGSGHPDIGRFGVHANVTGEPWHLQPFEIDGWQTWVDNGRSRPDPDFPIDVPIPDTPPPPPVEEPPPPPPPVISYAPGERELYVTDPQMNGMDIVWVQVVLRDHNGRADIVVDGNYGPQTEGYIKQIQAYVGAEATGTVDAGMWYILNVISKPPAAPDDYPIGTRYLKLTSPTMKGTDVAWVQATIAAQGIAISGDGVYGAQTRDRVKIVQGWNGLTKDGEVGPKTWDVLKRYRS